MDRLRAARVFPVRPPSRRSWAVGRPTVNNNAETLARRSPHYPWGAEWYANLGPPKNGGTRLFVSRGACEASWSL